MYFNRKNAEQKNWRMIKKGKHFLFGCSLVFAIGAALATPTVQADTAEAKVDAAVGTAQAEPNAEGPTYAAPAATSPVATEAVEANSATTVVSVDKTQLEAVLAQAKAKSLENQEASVKAEVEAAIAEAEALVANGSASQDQINQSVERLTHAVSSVKEVTEVVAEKTSEATTDSSATPKVRSRRATTEGTTRSIDETNLARAIVTKENFESFFQEGGTASYDKSTGTIKLTDDVSGQIGSAYLRFKIDSGEAFTFTGKVDIGDKYEGHVEPGLKEGYKVSVTSTGATDPSVNPVKAGDKVVTGKAEPGSSVEITLPYGTKLSGQADKYGNFSIPVRDRPGGDGVGFVFHTGKVDTIGQSGASIGMGTIKNAFGFKLDSWHNTSNPNANQNASADPKYGGRAWESNAFGSFYSSNNAGKVTTSSSAAKALNPAPSGQWVDFKIEYDKEKNFTVTYGSQTWTTNLSKANTSIMTFDAKRALTTGNPTFALSFLGSTGSGTNLQRVQIEKFEFTAPQIVHMKFVDAKGNEIEASSAIPGDENEVINLSTQDSKIAAVEAKGYKLKRIDASKAPSYNEGNNTVTLTPGGQLLTYIFEEKDTTPPATPTVNPVKAGATAVTGTAEAGSTVEVTLPGGSKVSAKADQDGNYSVPVSALKEGDTVSVTATDDAGNKSTPTSVTVPDTTAPAAPTVNPVTAGATAVTGTAEAGSTVEVTLPDGSKATATAGEDGTFSVPVSGLKENDEVSVTATDAAKNTSTPTKVTVKETVRPVLNIPYDDADSQAIYVYSGETNNIELKVTDNSGKIVKAYLAMPADNRTGLGQEDNTYLNGKTRSGLYLNAEKIKTETTATEASPAVIRVTGDIPKNTYTDGTGMTRYLFAEDAAGNTSYEHVGANMDKGALGRIRFIWKPQSFKYTAVAPSTPITSNTVPEASAIEKAVKDANPTFSDKIGSVTLDGTNVTVTYKDGSTDVIPANSVFTIEPTAPTVTPVKNPSSLTQPEKDAVKKAVETANKTATKVEVGNDGATTLTYSNGSTATLKPEQTVSQADITAPDAPTVNPVKAGATAITGTAEAGSTVEVTLPDGQKASAKAGENGEFSIPVPALNADDKISVTATDAADNKSTPSDVTVKENVRPVVNIPYDDKANQIIYVYSGEENNIELKITDNSGKIAKAYLVFAQDNRTGLGTEDAGYLNGKTKSALYLKANRFGSETTATETNPAIIKLTANIPNGSYTDGTGMTRYIYAEDLAGNTNYDNVGAAGDTGAPGRIRFVWKPQTFKYTAVAPSTPITSNTVPEASAIEKAVKDANPTFSDKIGSVALDGTNVTVTYKDGSTDVIPADSVFTIEPTAPTVTPVKNPSSLTQPEKDAVKKAVETANPSATKVEVGTDGTTTLTYSNGSTATLKPGQTVSQADITAPDAPVVNPVKAGDTAVTGTAEAGSTVEVTLPDGTKASATADQDGNFSVPVSGLEEGQTVSVTAKDASNNTSTPTTATVAKADDKTAPDAPVVNPVKAGDTAVTGTAEAGSTVEVTLPDGTKASATADKDGNFSVPVSGLEEGQTVSVTAKDASNNTSTPTTATVAKADDKTAPDAPVVNPVKAGDTAVTGTAEAGSTVEVTLPDGTKATATADKDGNFSVPVSGLEEGQTVSVTAKDASNNTSTPTTATVAKADDKTAPDAPVVNPVKAGDTAVTGTAEAGSTVEVTLPDGTKASATADKDGNFSVPVSGLEEGQTVSVTAKDASNNTSTPTTATVAKADDKTAPDAPVVNPVKAGDTAVTGTAEAGSTVEVTLPDGTKASATADQDGNFSVPVSGLEEGQTVSVTAKDASNNTSTPTTATVAKADDKTAPDAPVVNPVKAGDTAVTGTAEAGSTVEVTLPDGTKASATADQDGNFSVPVSGLEEGQTVSVTAKDASNNTSTPTTATVAKADDKTAPDAPVVNSVKAGDTAVTGTAEAGSTVEVTLPDGTKASATADQDGNFSVPVSGLEEGQTVSVTAKDASNNTSTPTTATVAKADDKTAPDAPVVNPVKAGDTAVTGTAEAGSTVEVTLPDGTKASATADQDGNFSVPVSGLEEGQTVSVTAKDASNNTSTPTTATVAKADDKTAPDAPVVNPVKAGDTAVTGTAEAGSTVEVTLPDGTKASATADQDGNFSVPVSGLEEGQTVSVTAKDASNNTSTPTTATVAKADDKTAPDAPVVNPVKAGDTAVTGTAEAGSTVEVTLPDGTKASATADQDGNFSVPVSGLEEGQTVSVTAKDASNNTSTPTTATVAKADDKTAPDAPVVNPVKAGDTAVTGTAEAGSTVEVTLPDGTKATATADKDGNFSVPVSGLEEGQTVSVTAKDASNNTSTPTTATVAKADDKTAPDAPVVNPVKAGDTAVTGTAEAGSTVEVTLPDGTKASATADKDGNFSVPVSGLEEGQTVSVTAKDASNNTSTPTTATVAKADDKTAPDAPVVNPVKAGDTAVTGTAEAGSTVEVTLPDGTKASATADKDGNFSVPVSGLEEGQTVSVTAKDASNNTSTPTTATVAKADDKTAPDAPVVNPVKAGDEAITGKAEPGSTVEVTLPGGAKKSATAGEDGTFSIPVSGLNENDEVSVTATDAAKNTSTPTTATVAKADDKTAPDAPVVNPVKAGDEAITGKAEPGSTVEVTLPDGTKATATADQDGNFSVPVSGLEEGQTVSVTATDAAKNTSTPTTATVAKADDKTAPDAPVVNPVKAGDEAITGKAEPGSTVEVTLPGGAKKSATAGEDGTFSIPVSGLNENDEVSVTATDAAKNTSTPTTATVAKADDKTAPDAPVVNPVKAGDTAVTGTAEAGSTVEVTLPDGTKASATADQDGNFSVPVSGLEEGQTVSVTAKDASNNTSTPTTATVAKADDKTAPDAPVVNPVKAGDTAVTGTAEAGSTVEVTLPDGTKATATADKDGNFSVPVSGLEEGQTVSVTAKDASNNTSTPTTATVAKADDKTAPDAPVVNPVKAGDTAVTGTAEAGSTVEVTLPDGTKASATADKDGNFSVPVSGLEEGQTVSVTAKDASNNTSTPTTATVAKADDKTAPDAPVVNPVKAGDTAVTGTAEAGSTVEVTLPDGTKASATADKDGNFSVPVSGLEEGQTVSVTAKDASNNTSTPTTATVAKADDKTAPDAPVVNPVKAGDEAITGKAEPGSTVEVTLPGGAKKSATAGEDGTFSIPVSGLNENDEVSVTATDAAKNTSTPTTATVAKADDKTAPDAPVVNPVKAGDEAITGKAEPGSTVEVTLPGGAKKSATAGEDGTFSIPVSGLNENDEVSVTATDAAKNTSTPTTATVAKADDKTAPDAPVVNPVKAGDEAITGKAEPGSTVEVTLPGGAKKSATAGEDGTFSIPVSGLNENDEVSVTATDAAKNTSTPTTATVAKADDKTAPDAPVVNPVKAGDEAITGKAEPGSTVEVTLPGGAKKSATAGEDGTFSIPVSGLNENDEVSVTATDAAKNTSTPTTATVAKADDKTAPDAPVVNPVKAGDEAITGKAEPGSTVEVTLPGGAKKSATAGEDGTFSIPVSGLNENDEVSVTATDAAKNTSTPTTATVAKADDKTAPDAPVVNPVKAGDEAITGKAEPGSTVEVTLPGGAKKSATAGEDGTFSIPVSGLNENDEVSVTATDAAKNTSTPTTATVAKADDKTAPDAPVVNPVKAGDEAITGKAEPGSTVEVTLPGGAKKSATAGEDGTFSIPVSGLNENDEVSVTATDAAKNTSTPTTATVAKADDKTAPDAPVVNPVKAGDEAITGKAEPGSTVEVTLPGGAKKSATAGEDGTFSIPVSGLNENDEVSVTATDAAKNTSTPTTATVAKADDKTAPDAPVVNPVKAGDEAITGKAEPGSTVEVTLPGGAKKSATAGEDGTFSIPVSGLNENDEVSVTATDAAKNTSTPTTATVAKADDKTAPDAPVVNPVKAGDEAITGKAEPGSTVEVTLPGGAKKSATAGEDGTFSIPVSGLNENDEVSVTATDAAKNTSTPTTATVAKADDKTAPDAPVVNPVKAGDEAITGKAEPGSTVEVTLPGGAKKSATAGEDGTFSIPVSGLNENDEVSVTATDAAKNTSTPTTATVAKADDKTAPDAPVVNPVKAGDEAITGKAEPGSTVEVTLPGGAKKSATAGEDGTFSIPVSGLNENDEVSVTATDAAKNTSTPTTATVAKADDKTAPDAPVVNPVKAGDEAITGKAEPGSTVEVTLPGGAKKSATAGEDGTFSIPVSGLNENDEVSVTATDAAKNTSTPTEKTVGKGDGKDADNVKVPALTPVVDPNNLTDAEKAKVVEEVKKVNPTATDVKVNNDGSVSVTYPDGSMATLTPAKTVKESETNGAKVPALTPVVDPNNLTDAEKAKVAEEVKKANPTATDVKVNNDGSVVVTFADGSVATIVANKVVKEATKESSAQAPSKKAGAKELPNTGTKQSNASLGLALLAAVTGGLLISKKRKEEE